VILVTAAVRRGLSMGQPKRSHIATGVEGKTAGEDADRMAKWVRFAAVAYLVLGFLLLSVGVAQAGGIGTT